MTYLESIGAQFGPHVNAYTSFDETVYMLDVPTDRAGVLTRGFEALSDFAGGVTLDPAEIDRERGVVIEEWRGRLGAGTRMQEPQMKALFGGSRYVDRLPIGTPEILKSFPPQRLRDFYRDYYRPDRMAVIVVGDIDPAAIEALIRKHFGALPARPPARAAGLSDSAASGHALRARLGPRGAGLVGHRHAQAAAARRCARSATTGGRWCRAWCTRCSTRASARSRASPMRRSCGASAGDDTLGPRRSRRSPCRRA